ncbi:toxin ParE1/3/4 [Bradyrhizobium sp. AZCC 1578]|uniref:type II toxin-antitoxin system RelE/ParE family toxin n=1 Tax=Bradyrhizobium sp. AZCC 1578 TaxID=3117027 RepID=UPI00304C2DC4
MKLVYSRRALADLDGISAYYAANASSAIADSVGRQLKMSSTAFAAPLILLRESRRDLRVVTVLRYPFRIFYRVRKDPIDILHIRHTSRRPVNEVDQ